MWRAIGGVLATAVLGGGAGCQNDVVIGAGGNAGQGGMGGAACGTWTIDFSESSGAPDGLTCALGACDKGCFGCAKTSCCSDFLACGSDLTCVCWMQCVEQYHNPSVCHLCGTMDAAATAIIECMKTNCPSPCN
jgi:hypothetical protein